MSHDVGFISQMFWARVSDFWDFSVYYELTTETTTSDFASEMVTSDDWIMDYEVQMDDVVPVYDNYPNAFIKDLCPEELAIREAFKLITVSCPIQHNEAYVNCS